MCLICVQEGLSNYIKIAHSAPNGRLLAKARMLKDKIKFAKIENSNGTEIISESTVNKWRQELAELAKEI